MVATLRNMPREKKPPTETVRLSKDLVRRINRIAAHLDKSVPDYLLEKLGPLIDKDEAQMLADMEKERERKPAKK